MDIVLLTIGYPYPKKDVFVSNEIEYLAENFDNVYIIPVLEGILFPKMKYPQVYDKLPKNVEIYRIKYNYTDILKLNKDLIRESIKCLDFNLKNIISILRFYIHSNIIINSLKKLRKEKNLNISNTILYSFWFHFNAMAIACESEDFALKISRAHGYDLYEERGTQPCKSFMLGKLDAVFTCSDMGKNYLREKYNTECKLSYLGTSNNCEKNDYILRCRYDEFNIVSCSSVISLKRIDKLIDSLSNIQHHKIKWTHIGDGPIFNDIREYAISKLSNKNNIKFEFKGNMNKFDILDYYNTDSINLFINVSSTEGLPVSIMEAMSYSIPVIATDVGGVKEIVDNNINGYLLDKEFESEDLSKLIEKIINMETKQYISLCKEAFSKWNSQFNASKNYNEFYANLIAISEQKGNKLGEHKKNDEKNF